MKDPPHSSQVLMVKRHWGQAVLRALLEHALEQYIPQPAPSSPSRRHRKVWPPSTPSAKPHEGTVMEPTVL